MIECFAQVHLRSSLTAPEVFVLSGYKHSTPNGVEREIKIHP